MYIHMLLPVYEWLPEIKCVFCVRYTLPFVSRKYNYIDFYSGVIFTRSKESCSTTGISLHHKVKLASCASVRSDTVCRVEYT